MELSIFIARTMGVIYLSVGLGLFFFREMYMLALRKILDSPAYAFLGGFMAVIGGVAMVTYHSIWVSDWRVIITIVGWVVLVKGVMLLIMPGYIRAFRGALLVRFGKYLTIASLLFGLVLSYFGFF